MRHIARPVAHREQAPRLRAAARRDAQLLQRNRDLDDVAIVGEARREDVHRNALLPDLASLDREPVQLLDRIVRDGETTFGLAAAMDVDVATQGRVLRWRLF